MTGSVVVVDGGLTAKVLSGLAAGGANSPRLRRRLMGNIRSCSAA
jgi:hypothetical protein